MNRWAYGTVRRRKYGSSTREYAVQGSPETIVTLECRSCSRKVSSALIAAAPLPTMATCRRITRQMRQSAGMVGVSQSSSLVYSA